MKDLINTFNNWVVDLGDKHGVNPVLIFFLYLISKVSLVVCVGWAINKIRHKKPFALPLLLAGAAFCIPYTYLIIVGRNMPVWIYVLVALIFGLGVYAIWVKISSSAK